MLKVIETFQYFVKINTLIVIIRYRSTPCTISSNASWHP